MTELPTKCLTCSRQTLGLIRRNMYGLILENLAEYIRQVYGEDRWEEIRRQASVDQPSFSVHQVYPENLIPRLAKKAIQVRLE